VRSKSFEVSLRTAGVVYEKLVPPWREGGFTAGEDGVCILVKIFIMDNLSHFAPLSL